MSVCTILHVIDTVGPGGAETVYLDLVSGLDTARFKSIVTTGVPAKYDHKRDGSSEHGWLYDTLVARGIDPVVLPTTRPLDIAYLMRIVRLARVTGANMIHSHLLTANVYASAAGILMGIPVVSTFHGVVDVNTRSRQTRLKLALVNRGSARIVFVSNNLRRALLATGLDPAKSVVIHNGVDGARYSPARNTSLRERFNIAPDELVVGAVGNVRPAKGYDNLMDAAALLKDVIRMRILIAGEGSGDLWNSLVARRAHLGLEQVVSLIGFERDVPRFLNGLDIFVLPSHSEGFSLSTVEAMACGLPVIATRSGGPEEIVKHGETGLLVATAEPRQLADALAELAANAALRERLGRGARQHAEQNFTTGAMVRRYEALYGELAPAE